MKKKMFFITGICVFIFFILLYPSNCLESARRGTDLWLTVVLPSLLPFMVASFILLETGIVRLISFFFTPITRFLFYTPGESAYVFFAAAFSGYPIGAKLASELYARNQITETDAQAIIRFTSVTGPVFLTGAVSTGMLGLPESGVYLVATHYLSAVLTGVVFGIIGRTNKRKFQKKSFRTVLHEFKKDIAACRPFSDILTDGIEKSLSTLLKIGGFIIVFSVLIEILSISKIIDAAAWIYSPIIHLTGLSADSTRAMLFGGIEMTTGCGYAAALGTDPVQILPVISSIIAFGGACIHMQTKSVCIPSGIVPKRFLAAKSLQGIFAYILCSLLLALFPMSGNSGGVTADIKTAAFYGIFFAAASIILLIIVKYLQKRKSASSFLFLGRKF